MGENTVKHNSCDKILGKNILRGQFTFELGEVRRNKYRRDEGRKEGLREGGREGGRKGGEGRKKEGIPSFLI